MPAGMPALRVQRYFEGADGVFDDAEAGEELGEGDEGAKGPVFAFDQGDGTVALGGVAEVTGLACEEFAADGQFDARRFFTLCTQWRFMLAVER